MEQRNSNTSFTENKKDVAVIIPVHNGADYLEETLRCVINQTLRSIEIIVVDDGSTDDTAAIVSRLHEEDERIRYIYQDKANAGVARNRGMEATDATAVIFLDGDDLFESEMLEKMYGSLVEYRADIVVCDADQYDTQTQEYLPKPQYMRSEYLPEDKSIFSKAELGEHILYFTTSVPWNKLFRASFLKENHLQFQDIERANDQYLSILALLLADKITAVREVLVHYRINQKGNLTTEFSKTPLCAYQAMVATKEALTERGLIEDAKVKQAFDNKVINLMIYSLNIQRSAQAYKELYDVLSGGGLEQLGLAGEGEEHYFNPLEYQNLQSFLSMPYDQFLVMKNREYRDVIARKNVRYKEMVNKKDAVIADLKEKEKELKEIKRKNWYKKMVKWIDRYHSLRDKIRPPKDEGDKQ